MATKETSAEPSETECPVCQEDFKQPKLLPCGHSYCLECLEQIEVNKNITCPECRRQYEVPERGVTAFPDNRFVAPLLRLKNTFQCMEHGIPLHFFCENCGDQICSSCETVDHRGHTIVKIKSKAIECREDLKKTKDSVRELGLQLGTHLNKLNENVDVVNKTTSKSLDAIDDRREELHNEIKKMHDMVQVETERMKTEMIKRQRENLQKIQKAKEETSKAKSHFDEMYVDIENGMKHSTPNEIVQKRGSVQKKFEQSKIRHLVNNEFDVELNNLKFTNQDYHPEMKPEEIGSCQDSNSRVSQPEKVKEESIEAAKFAVLKATDIETFDPELEKWVVTKMCVIRDGHVIISGMVGGENWLKCFSTNGNCLWRIKMGKADANIAEVQGLCHVPNNNEYFILTRARSIELRRVKDGAVVGKRDTEFTCSHVCATDRAVLVIDSHSKPNKLVNLKINLDSDICFELTNVTIDANLNTTFGLNILNHNGRKMVIAASWKEKTIEAIDYTTGEIVWKISGEYDGKTLEPLGVCHDDVGNLYVADGTNCRVLVVSPDGVVKQKLIDTPRATCWIGWLDSQRLVVNYTNYKECIKIYKIDYVEKDK